MIPIKVALATAVAFLPSPAHHHPKPQGARAARHSAAFRRAYLRRAAAVRAALGQAGVPYEWGGTTPGVGLDCSGLVQYAYRMVGVYLPRTTWDMLNVGWQVGLNALRLGDLVFSEGGGHVGMYVGGGQVVAAPYTGTVVQTAPLSTWSIYQVRRVLP